MTMVKSLRLSGAVAAALILGCSAAAGAELTAPKGPVVLTVVGDIANANRGPSDPAVDRFLDHHEQKFDAAAAFDLQMLEGLGMETRQFVLEGLPGVQKLEGPPLAAVLEAVGAQSGKVSLLALDGFAVELDAKDVEAHDWLVGVKRNYDYLGIGGFGPAWMVFSPAAADQVVTDEENEMWPYQVFLLRVGSE
jgi:hypothetical protein